jgi:Ser/Thr protein kinase RdoA (MazF antagonist)
MIKSVGWMRLKALFTNSKATIRQYILRIGHSLRRNESADPGEVDWINFLAEGGVSVPRAIRSSNGKYVEVVEDGQDGQFLATAFVRHKDNGLR